MGLGSLQWLLDLKGSQSLGVCMVSHIWLFATPQTVAHQAPLSTWDSPGKNTDVCCHFLLQGSSWLRDQTCIYRIGRQVLYHCAIWEAPQSLGIGEILAGRVSSQCCHRDVFSSSSLVAQRLGGSRLQPILFSFHIKGKWVNSCLENKARTLSWISDSPCVCVCACSVAQSCLTLCGPLDCSSPASSVYRIFQTRVLEWVASPYRPLNKKPVLKTYQVGILSAFYGLPAAPSG